MSFFYFYFLPALGITLGLISPFILFRLSVRGLEMYREYRDYVNARQAYERAMSPRYWIFVRVEQAPNPNFLKLWYKNSETREDVDVAVEWSKLDSLISAKYSKRGIGNA